MTGAEAAKLKAIEKIRPQNIPEKLRNILLSNYLLSETVEIIGTDRFDKSFTLGFFVPSLNSLISPGDMDPDRIPQQDMEELWGDCEYNQVIRDEILDLNAQRHDDLNAFLNTKDIITYSQGESSDQEFYDSILRFIAEKSPSNNKSI